MTPEFRERLIEAAAAEALKLGVSSAETRPFVTGLLVGYTLGNPHAFAGMCSLTFAEPGGVVTLVREAVDLNRMVAMR